jgi:hypothetical protein
MVSNDHLLDTLGTALLGAIQSAGPQFVRYFVEEADQGPRMLLPNAWRISSTRVILFGEPRVCRVLRSGREGDEADREADEAELAKLAVYDKPRLASSDQQIRQSFDAPRFRRRQLQRPHRRSYRASSDCSGRGNEQRLISGTTCRRRGILKSETPDQYLRPIPRPTNRRSGRRDAPIAQLDRALLASSTSTAPPIVAGFPAARMAANAGLPSASSATIACRAQR